MRRWLAWLAGGSLLVMQVGLLPAWRPGGVVPDAVMAAVIIVGLRSSVSASLALALWGGVAMDSISGGQFGLHTGLLVLAALSAGLVRQAGIGLAGSLMALLLMAAATIISNLIVIGGLILNGVLMAPGSTLALVLIELVVNLVVVIGLRPIVYRLVPDAAVRADMAV